MAHYRNVRPGCTLVRDMSDTKIIEGQIKVLAARKYIKNKKPGNIINFKLKKDGRKKKGKEFTGKVVKVFDDKIVFSCKLPDRFEITVVTLNMIVDGTYEEVSRDEK